MMKESRARTILAAQTAIAQKVYAAIPIQDAWSMQAICAELNRRGLSASGDRRILNGCINTLIESGLVSEKSAGLYQRTPTRADKELETPMSTAKKESAQQPKKKSSIDRLSDLSSLFIALSNQMKEAADELETVAIELADHAEQSEEDAAKFKQLQQLLKSIGA